MKKLPDKPSELLLLALRDLEQVENDPRYIVDMGTWHQPNGKCAVCMAGSVMAQTLGVLPSIGANPGDFDADTEGKLDALNAFRTGDFAGAFVYLGRAPSPLPSHAEVDLCEMSYVSRNEWKLHMQTLVGILQAEGL